MSFMAPQLQQALTNRGSQSVDQVLNNYHSSVRRLHGSGYTPPSEATPKPARPQYRQSPYTPKPMSSGDGPANGGYPGAPIYIGGLGGYTPPSGATQSPGGYKPTIGGLAPQPMNGLEFGKQPGMKMTQSPYMQQQQGQMGQRPQAPASPSIWAGGTVSAPYNSQGYPVNNFAGGAQPSAQPQAQAYQPPSPQLPAQMAKSAYQPTVTEQPWQANQTQQQSADRQGYKLNLGSDGTQAGYWDRTGNYTPGTINTGVGNPATLASMQEQNPPASQLSYFNSKQGLPINQNATDDYGAPPAAGRQAGSSSGPAGIYGGFQKPQTYQQQNSPLIEALYKGSTGGVVPSPGGYNSPSQLGSPQVRAQLQMFGM